MDKKVKVGLVGYGMAGEVFHAPVISVIPNLELRSIVERNSENSRKRYPQVKIVRSVDELLQDKEIELVVVATPNITHFNIAKQSLLAGKHVVIDKPFTVTSSEAQELIELASKQNKIVSVFQNRRLDGDFLTVKKIIQGKKLGQLVEYESHFDRYVNFIRDNPWKESDAKGNGLVYDLGSHLIDQALVLFGLPNSIYADMEIRRETGKIIDNFEIILYYDTLKVILRSGLLVREAGARFTLHGTKGSFVKFGIDPQEEALKQGMVPTGNDWGKDSEQWWGILNTQIDGKHWTGKVETERGNYQLYYENIYNAIRGKEDLLVKPIDALNTIRVIEAAMQSSTEKRVVPFSGL